MKPRKLAVIVSVILYVLFFLMIINKLFINIEYNLFGKLFVEFGYIFEEYKNH